MYDMQVSSGLSKLSEQELGAIQDFCNDQVMKLHRLYRKTGWAKKLDDNHLYAVFQCFAEDTVARNEDFEYYELEYQLDYLRKEKIKKRRELTASLLG